MSWTLHSYSCFLKPVICRSGFIVSTIPFVPMVVKVCPCDLIHLANTVGMLPLIVNDSRSNSHCAQGLRIVSFIINCIHLFSFQLLVWGLTDLTGLICRYAVTLSISSIISWLLIIVNWNRSWSLILILLFIIGFLFL